MDVLRGFALLGILLMNIQSFAMVGMAYINPTVMGGMQGVDYWVWLVTHVLADQKFMTIFSLLFGASLAMMTGRQAAAGRSPASLHYRRMGWLMVIGLLHAYLLWFGDILVVYSFCGAVVFLFRKLPCWLLVVIGMLSISVASMISLVCGLTMPYWPDEIVEELQYNHWSPTADWIEQEVAIYRGDWLDQMPLRAETAFYMEVFGLLFFLAWRAGGLMLIGMALYRWGVLTGRRSTAFYVAAGRRGRRQRSPAGRVWRVPQHRGQLECRLLLIFGKPVQLLGKLVDQRRLCGSGDDHLQNPPVRHAALATRRSRADGTDELPAAEHYLHDDLLWSRARTIRALLTRRTAAHGLNGMGVSTRRISDLVALFSLRSVRVAVAVT